MPGTSSDTNVVGIAGCDTKSLRPCVSNAEEHPTCIATVQGDLERMVVRGATVLDLGDVSVTLVLPKEVDVLGVRTEGGGRVCGLLDGILVLRQEGGPVRNCVQVLQLQELTGGRTDV